MPRKPAIAASFLLMALLAGPLLAAQDQDLFRKHWDAVSLPHKRVVLSTKLVERVSDILVKEGDTVKRGDLLIKLDARILERQIEAAEAGADFKARIASAKVRHEHLAREHDRLKLVREGVSESQIDRARTERDLAALDVEELQRQEKASRVQVAYHKARLHDYRIISPVEGTGVVSSIWVEIGEMVDEAQRLVEVIDPKLVEVHVHVPERNLPLLQIVNRVEVTFPAVDKKHALPAKVHFVSPYVDSASGTCMVKLLVTLRDDSLIKPGLACVVRFHDMPIIIDTDPKAEPATPKPEAD